MHREINEFEVEEFTIEDVKKGNEKLQSLSEHTNHNHPLFHPLESERCRRGGKSVRCRRGGKSERCRRGGEFLFLPMSSVCLPVDGGLRSFRSVISFLIPLILRSSELFSISSFVLMY